jgi:Tfp pilus assembly protein PilO
VNLADPVLQKRIFIVMIAALLAYVYFGSTFLPIAYRVRKAKIEQISSEVEETERKLKIANSQAGRLEVLQPRLARMEADWRRVERLLPREEAMPSFVKELSSNASRAGVKIDLLVPARPIQGDGVKSSNIEVKVHGDYHRVGEFLSFIANGKRVVGTAGLTVTGIKSASRSRDIEGGRREGTVEATFTAILYMLGGNTNAPG